LYCGDETEKTEALRFIPKIGGIYDIQHGLKICGWKIIDPQPGVERRDQEEKLRIPSRFDRAVRLERQGRIATIEGHRFGERSDRLV